MNDEPTTLGGSDVGVGKAAHLPLAVDRAAFQPELDSLGRSPALRVGMPGSSRMEIITPRRWQPLPDGPAAFARIGGAKFPSALGIAVATLGLAIACWFVSALQMSGMDMGVATRLGSFASFIGVWVTMMAAMMLPGAVPAVLQRSRSGGVFTAPVFAGTYVAIWAIVGIAVYVLYRPHGTVAAGVVVIAAGVYELTPIKRHFRLRCRDQGRSGLVFGLDCVGSSIGLMAILVVVGVMSVAWMAVIAVVIVAQKILPTRAVIDIPLAFAIVGLGILILADPSAIPGLIPPTVPTPMM